MKKAIQKSSIFLVIYLASFSLFIFAMIFPNVKKIFIIDKILWYTGLVAPNVFNRADLKMSEKWFVILGEQRELMPYTGYEGERLSMHRSDVIYYANSLLWRRMAINHTWDHILAEKSAENIYIKKTLTFLSKRLKLNSFTVIFFENNSASESSCSTQKYQSKKIAEYKIETK